VDLAAGVRAYVTKYDHPYPCPSDDADASRWPVGDDDLRKEPL
jgi:hypothetical protein